MLHLCPKCNRPRDLDGYSYCPSCRERSRNYSKTYYQRVVKPKKQRRQERAFAAFRERIIAQGGTWYQAPKKS
jgi:uncharacterized Zn finger protein (UPF0148 family)